MMAAADAWANIILSREEPRQVWESIFSRLRDLALDDPAPAELHRQTIGPDRLLAESAWSLWQDFAAHAPKVVEELQAFWSATTASGTAVLILDGLSLRELPLIVNAAKTRGIPPVRIEVCGSQVPTETDQFAAALGIPARAKLFNNKPPGTFIFAGPDTSTDVLDAPFED